MPPILRFWLAEAILGGAWVAAVAAYVATCVLVNAALGLQGKALAVVLAIFVSVGAVIATALFGVQLLIAIQYAWPERRPGHTWWR